MFKKISIPENLSIAQIIREHRMDISKHDFDYHAFVLGQSPFPVPNLIQEALIQGANKGMYSTATGIIELKKNIVDFNQHYFKLNLSSQDIFISNGTKMLIFMIISILDGTFILPTPAWVGYEPILKYLNKKYIKLRLNPSTDYELDLPDFENVIGSVDRPILIFNNPHNPTGAVHSSVKLEKLTHILKENNAWVIADEIYGLLTYDEGFQSLYSFYPEKTFVTQGISKDRSAAGYRLGVGILPKEERQYFIHQLEALASTMYTNVSTPIQYAAVTAYSINHELDEYMANVKNIHSIVGKYFSHYAKSLNLEVSTPKSAFYLILNFNPLREILEANDIYTSSQLSQKLMKAPYYVAVVMGAAISVDEEDFIARIALVDYDGASALADFIKNPPMNNDEISQFIDRNMFHMKLGFKMISQFIEELKKPV